MDASDSDGIATGVISHFSSGLELASTATTSPSTVVHSAHLDLEFEFDLGSEFDPPESDTDSLESDTDSLESDTDSSILVLPIHQGSLSTRDSDERSNYLISSYELQEALEAHRS